MELSKCPKNGKKSHASREEAEGFATRIKADHPEQVLQHAYACEDCPHWHLSALPPDSYNLARPTVPTPVSDDSRATKYMGKKEEIAKLRHQGKDLMEISAITGVPYGSVRHYLIELGLYQPNMRGERTNQIVSIESLDEEEAKALALVEQIRNRKQKLIELKALKIELLDSGVLLKKEGNVLQFSFEEAAKLIEKVIDYVPTREKILERLTLPGVAQTPTQTSESHA
jgi:hypothetical protein